MDKSACQMNKCKKKCKCNVSHFREKKCKFNIKNEKVLLNLKKIIDFRGSR